MELLIDPEIKDLVPALRAEEYKKLRESIAKEGCRDPLVIWSEHNTILDGHNRFQICQELGAVYNTVSLEFPDKDSAMLWILKNQLGRRNLTKFQFKILVGQEYELEKKLEGRPKLDTEKLPQNEGVNSGETAERLAKEHNISRATVERSADIFKAYEQIKKVAPEMAERLGTNDFKPSEKSIFLLGRVLSEGTPEQRDQVASEINEDPMKAIETARKILSPKPDPLPELSNARDDYLKSMVAAAIPAFQNNATNHALIATRMREIFCPRCGKPASEVLRWSCCGLSVEEAAKEAHALLDGQSSKVDEKTGPEVSGQLEWRMLRSRLGDSNGDFGG